MCWSDGGVLSNGTIFQVLTGSRSADPLTEGSGARTMPQGTRRPRAPGSAARHRWLRVSGRQTSLSHTRRGFAQQKLQEALSREPDCGNRNVACTRGAGETAKAWEASGKRGSNIETRLLPTTHHGYPGMTQEGVWNHYPHRSSNCRSMALAGQE